MRSDRWEQGSDYEYPATLTSGQAIPLPHPATYWHSGRDALRALVRHVGAKRVLFPSFYCQDVIRAVRRDGVDVAVYRDGPLDTQIPVAALSSGAGDLVIVTNTYGLRSRAAPRYDTPRGVVVAEDHTHDPWSEWATASSADWAFASLRKWLPLPDGAILWSPRAAHEVPAAPAVDDPHAAVTLERLTGMLLKSRYFASEPIDKETFRAPLVAGEQGIGRGTPGAMTRLSRALLDMFPVAAWRKARLENHRTFVAALEPAIEVLTSAAPAPFVITVCLVDAHARDRLRARLIAQRIYPAMLWPIDGTLVPGTPQEHVTLSQRLLSVHCDHRYDREDMERVAIAVSRALAEDRR